MKSRTKRVDAVPFRAPPRVPSWSGGGRPRLALLVALLVLAVG